MTVLNRFIFTSVSVVVFRVLWGFRFVSGEGRTYSYDWYFVEH